MSERVRVGFIGLGQMGAGMAFNLVTKGYPLTVLGGRAAAAVAELRGLGAAVADDVATLARGVDIVQLCLPSSREVEAVAGALGDGLRPGMTVIDSTTADPQASAALQRSLAARGVTLVDAPVTRTPADARAGKLNILVGAEAATLARIRPVLACVAENIFHAGPPGAGHRLKLIANFLTLTHAVAAAEAAILARAAGIDARVLHEVASAGGSNSAAFQMMMPFVLEREIGRFRFSVANAEKDLRYLCRMAAEAGCVDLLAGAAHRALGLGLALGEPGALMPQLVDPLARLARTPQGT